MLLKLLPNFLQTDFLVHWVKASRRITERVSKEMRSIPGVRNFGSHIGRLAVVILGRLISSTVLNLLVAPTS